MNVACGQLEASEQALRPESTVKYGDVAGNWQTGGEILGEGRFVRTLRPGQVTSVYRSVGHWFPLACLVSWGVWVLRRRRASRPE